MQTDPLSPWLPSREVTDDCSPGPAAVPGVRPGHGGSWDTHGYSASMGKVVFLTVLFFKHLN